MRLEVKIVPKDNLAIRYLHGLAFDVLSYHDSVSENFIEISDSITFNFQVANLGHIPPISYALQIGVAWGLEGLATVAFLEKRVAQARLLHKESLQLKADVMDVVGIAYSFEGLAQVAASDEEPEHAALLWGAADRLHEATNTPLEPSRYYAYVSLIPVARAQMGDIIFNETYANGRALKLTEAIRIGLEE